MVFGKKQKEEEEMTSPETLGSLKHLLLQLEAVSVLFPSSIALLCTSRPVVYRPSDRLRHRHAAV